MVQLPLNVFKCNFFLELKLYNLYVSNLTYNKYMFKYTRLKTVII